MISGKTSRRTVRGIALLETAKGLLVLAAGFGLISLLHQDVQAAAIRLIANLHLHPGRKYVDIFINAASQVTDKQLWSFAGLALVYSAFRLCEGYGLWRERAWAEWLALGSGMVYLPLEVYELVLKFTWLRVSVLVINLLIVVLVALVLWRSIRSRSPEERRPVT